MTLSEIKQKIDEYFANHTEQEVYDALVRSGTITEESPESATIVGYVARDNVVLQHRDLGLHLFTTLPTRSKIWQEWQGLRGKSLLLDPDLFPSVTWKSEPKKYRITITPIEE